MIAAVLWSSKLSESLHASRGLVKHLIRWLGETRRGENFGVHRTVHACTEWSGAIFVLFQSTESRALASIFIIHVWHSFLHSFIPIPSLTEKSITQADRNRLGLSVIGQRSFTKFSSNTRLLVATEWDLVVEHVVLVDPDGTSTERIRDTNSGVEVLGVDSGGKTVSGVVASLDDLLLGLKLRNRADRAEDFFLHDLHVFSDIGEDGRLNEVSLVAVTLTTSDNGSTGLLALLNVTHNAVILKLRDLWALEGIGSEWVTDLVGGSTFLESLDELVVNTRLNINTGTSTATLAVVKKDTEVDP